MIFVCGGHVLTNFLNRHLFYKKGQLDICAEKKTETPAKAYSRVPTFYHFPLCLYWSLYLYFILCANYKMYNLQWYHLRMDIEIIESGKL